MDSHRVDAPGAVAGPDEDWIWADSPPPDRPPREVPAAPDVTAPDTSAYDAAVAAYQARLAHAQVATPAEPAPDADGPRSARLRDTTGHAARVALGLTVLAAERLGSPTNDSFALGVGIAQQTASGLRDLAGRFAGRPARAAYRTLDWATKRTSLRANAGPLARRREEVRRLVQLARERGQATVEAGRAEASTFLQANVTDGMAWAEDQAVPQMVDGLVPHLVESVVPQIVDGIVPHLVETVVPQVIDGVMPEIRARVLPVIIDDLTNDPRLRELVLEQSRGVVGEAAQQLRSATATADDRVEQAFRRLVHGESSVHGESGGHGESSVHGESRDRDDSSVGDVPGVAGTAERTSREG